MERKIIYLDDAIDALRYAQHRFTVADEAGGMGTVKWSEDVIYFATAERVLAELPSAQPDLIRRSEVIEAIDNIDWYHQNASNEMVIGANPDEHQAWYKAEDIYRALESVPSAQPERMTNFELITQDENTLANWLSDTGIDCDMCPVWEECVKDDGPIRDRCFRLIRNWLKTEDGQEPEPDVFPW